MIDIKVLTGQMVVVHCPTQKEVKQIAEILQLVVLSSSIYWTNYKENCCISLENRMYGSFGWYTQHGYQVLNASDILTPNYLIFN